MSNFPLTSTFSSTIIDRNVISRDEVVKCVIDIERGISEGKTGHIIQARNKLVEIDILLVAYLVLYRKSNPDFKFRIWLNNANKDEEIHTKLQRYRTQAMYAAMVDIFSISFWDGSDDSPIQQEEQRFEPEKFDGLGTNFAPILVITRNTIDSLFFKSFKPDLPTPKIPSEFLNDNARLQKLNSDAWIEKLNSESSPAEGKTSALAVPAFWRALQNAKILNFYLCRENKELLSRCTYGSYSHENIIDHFRALEPLFIELESKPPIFHFVYNLLLGSDLMPGRLLKKDMRDFQQKAKNLWDFTIRLVTGLSELARNITQHSSKKEGVITLRIYERAQFAELFDTKRISFDAPGIKNASAVVDINVLDLGVNGVISTLAKAVSRLSETEENEVLKASFAADRDKLNDGAVSLSDLLNPRTGIQLDHQAKRAVAHLGLQIFSKIVEEKGGTIKASSWKGPDSRDTVPPESEGGRDYEMAPIGTNFNVLLPIEADREYGTRLPGVLPVPKESTRAEMLSLDDFFTLPSITLRAAETQIDPSSRDVSQSCVTYRLRPKSLIDTASERALWTDFNLSCRSSFPQAKFRALDFEQIRGLTASNLFRFLGRWELEFSGKSLILFNIPNEIVLDLVDINDDYTTLLNIGIPPYEVPVPYWNRDTMQLIYSYVLVDEEMRFHLADALWGEGKDDFIAANKMICNTNFFNSITLIENPDFIGGGKSNSNFADFLRGFDLFYDGTALLPFDLILKSADDISLFEQNAQSLLMNELRVD